MVVHPSCSATGLWWLILIDRGRKGGQNGVEKCSVSGSPSSCHWALHVVVEVRKIASLASGYWGSWLNYFSVLEMTTNQMQMQNLGGHSEVLLETLLMLIIY